MRVPRTAGQAKMAGSSLRCITISGLLCCIVCCRCSNICCLSFIVGVAQGLPKFLELSGKARPSPTMRRYVIFGPMSNCGSKAHTHVVLCISAQCVANDKTIHPTARKVCYIQSRPICQHIQYHICNKSPGVSRTGFLLWCACDLSILTGTYERSAST